MEPFLVWMTIPIVIAHLRRAQVVSVVPEHARLEAHGARGAGDAGKRHRVVRYELALILLRQQNVRF